MQEEESDDGLLFRPVKFQIYGTNWSEHQHLSDSPDAVQDLPDPTRFTTPQGFRDQLRGIYRMAELGIESVDGDNTGDTFPSWTPNTDIQCQRPVGADSAPLH